MAEPTLYNFYSASSRKRQPKINPPLKVYTEAEYEELQNATKQVHQAFVKKKIDFSKF